MPTAEAAAVRLTNEAFQRGSNDNISCIVVSLSCSSMFQSPSCGSHREYWLASAC